MSRLSELIRDLCPDGVEYRPLGEVAELQRGSGMPKALFREQGVKAIHYGHIYTTYGVYIRDTIVAVDAHAAKKLTTVHPGDLVVANTSENLEDVGSAVAWLGDVDAVTGGHATVIRSTMDPRFLSYYFRTPQFYYEKRRFANGTKVIELSAAKLARIRIPVPPLEVQQEIVRILDQFTTLEAELEAELEARRKQYDHYRDVLIRSVSCESGNHWVQLRDLGSWVGGGTPSKERAEFWEGGCIPWVTPKDMGNSVVRDSQDHITETAVMGSSVRLVEAPSLAVVVRSSILQRMLPIADVVVDATFNQDMKVLRVFDDYCRRYVFHVLRASSDRLLVECRKQGGSVNSLVTSRFLKSEIPIPPLDRQRHIADTLDRFDALVNSISSGLPAEIAARRKQYEHYRNMVLTFPERKR